MLEVNFGLLIVVLTFTGADFVMITRRILKNASIVLASFKETRATYNMWGLRIKERQSHF